MSRTAAALLLIAAGLGPRSAHTASAATADAPRRPNIVLIMTDDQGWGDLSLHGNPHLQTPHIDSLARDGAELTHFYVSPVCSPTRASLMTGRYNYRTGAIDTYLGRSTMVSDEVTLAEMLRPSGYRTGIFGKWHLGDNYPSRPMDQGFEESLVHRGGGMVQPADPPGGSYFDPVLQHNGRQEQARGYASDVFTQAAMDFISHHKAEAFFVYLAFNCPHTPLQVPPEYLNKFQNKSLNDATARVYGMVANIDDNLGRLFARLKEFQLENDTLVIFLTDNGPQQPRYNGVLRDLKGSVYDGGIRAPCLIRWPGHVPAGAKVDTVAAHLDLAPTLLAACGIQPPAAVRFDGRSLWNVLQGTDAARDERLLFFQWHRGDEPQRGRACAVRGPQFKLVQSAGRGENDTFTPSWELYDIAADPAETSNVIAEHPEVAADMRAAYDRWFDDVGSTRGYPPPRIVAGTRHENPITLTRQDWRGPQAGWRNEGLGHWDVDFAAAAPYDVTVRMPPLSAPGKVRLQIGTIEQIEPVAAGADQATFRAMELPPGLARVTATVEVDGRKLGAHYVDLHCLRPLADPARGAAN
ncbi:MAG: arylsulfatase [Pirellulales bacterium]